MKKDEEEGRERGRGKEKEGRGGTEERTGIYGLTEGPWRDF